MIARPKSARLAPLARHMRVHNRAIAVIRTSSSWKSSRRPALRNAARVERAESSDGHWRRGTRSENREQQHNGCQGGYWRTNTPTDEQNGTLCLAASPVCSSLQARSTTLPTNAPAPRLQPKPDPSGRPITLRLPRPHAGRQLEQSRLSPTRPSQEQTAAPAQSSPPSEPQQSASAVPPAPTPQAPATPPATSAAPPATAAAPPAAPATPPAAIAQDLTTSPQASERERPLDSAKATPSTPPAGATEPASTAQPSMRDQPAALPDQAASAPKKENVLVVMRGPANIRSAPGKNGRVIGTAPRDATVKELDRSHGYRSRQTPAKAGSTRRCWARLRAGSRSDRAEQSDPKQSAGDWLPFLDTYRTMCLAPEPAFRQILEDVRELRFAA